MTVAEEMEDRGMGQGTETDEALTEERMAELAEEEAHDA